MLEFSSVVLPAPFSVVMGNKNIICVLYQGYYCFCGQERHLFVETPTTAIHKAFYLENLVSPLSPWKDSLVMVAL